MIVRRGLAIAVTAGAVIAAAGVVIVSIAYALFALFEPHVGAAGASALVALCIALLAALVAAIGARIAFPHAKKTPGRPLSAPVSPTARAMEFVKARPLAGGVAIIAAGIAGSVFLVRNPLLATAVIKSVLDSRNPPTR